MAPNKQSYLVSNWCWTQTKMVHFKWFCERHLLFGKYTPYMLYNICFIYSGDFDLISGHQTCFYSIMHIYKRKKCLNFNQNKMPMNCTVYTLCPVESVSCPYIEYFSILNGTHTVSFVYKIQIYCQHCIIDVHEWIYVSCEFLYPENSSCFTKKKCATSHQG